VILAKGAAIRTRRPRQRGVKGAGATVEEGRRGEGNKATKEAAKQKTYHALGKHGAKNEEERKTRNKAAKDERRQGRGESSRRRKKKERRAE